MQFPTLGSAPTLLLVLLSSCSTLALGLALPAQAPIETSLRGVASPLPDALAGTAAEALELPSINVNTLLTARNPAPAPECLLEKRQASSLALNLEQVLACVNALTELGLVCVQQPGTEACIASLAAIWKLEGCMPTF